MYNTIGVLILSSLVLRINGKNLTLPRFPKTFKFGTATSSYQVEGGWNEGGKGENIWDRLTHNRPRLVTKCATGDIACDSYHNYMRDIDMVQEIGADYYRFSISWARVLPTGFNNKINADGIKYYDDIVNELLARNITPFVTLYHWELPQRLQEIGGWASPLMESIFTDYARIMFQHFGDRVKNWLTFNEPKEICYEGYEGSFAPALPFPGYGPYLCAHNVLKAHGRTYRMYDNHFKPTQKGRVGLTLSSMWFEPRNPSSKEDVTAAETAQQFELGWYAHPIFNVTDGDYPLVMKSRISRPGSVIIGESRLPTFTAEEIDMLKGSADFFGLNHYTTRMAAEYTEGSESVFPVPSYMDDRGVLAYVDPKWPGSGSSWLKVVPWGFRKLLVWIKKEYNDPEVIVFENGYADEGQLEDWDRVMYYQTYLTALQQAIILDQCRVTAYFAWSLMDNFEWLEGYSQKFGLYKVDFDDPKRTRTPKVSALVLKEIFRSFVVDYDYEPPVQNGKRSSYHRRPRSVQNGCGWNNFKMSLLIFLIINVLKSVL